MTPRVGRLLAGLLAALAPVACIAADLPPGPPAVSLRNGGFDESTPNPAVPPGWGSQGSAYGSARVVERAGASGGRAIELAPGVSGSSDAKSFMLYQVLDAAALRGRTVEFGARVATDGAGVNLVVWSPEGSGNDFASDVERPQWVERRSTFAVPGNASMLTFGVQVLGPFGSRAWVDDVFVTTEGAAKAGAAAAAESAAKSGSSAARVTIRAADVERELPPEFFGMHIEWFEDASGIVAPGTGRPRKDVVALLRPLDIALLRFPGGISADFYDWRKGVGPQRGELRNPFNGKRETVHFGSLEFVELARDLGAAACVTANYGTGTPADAAAWAAWFKDQGFQPDYWEIGNEIYLSGPEATGPNSREIYRPGAHYAKDFPAFAEAIKRVNPKARVGAIAHLDTGAFPLADRGNPDWTREMLRALETQVDFFALHNGYAPVVIDDSLDLSREADRVAMYRAMLSAPQQVADNLETMAEEIRRRSPGNAAAPFAITEFSTLIGISGRKEKHLAYVDHTRTQASALYVASVLDVYMADPRVMMTMYTNPVHRYYGNLILADPSGLVKSPTYYLYLFYADRFERRLVATETQSPTFSSGQVGVVKARAASPALLARASKSADGRRLTLLLVNRSLDDALETDVAIDGFRASSVSCQLLAAAEPNAINGPPLTDTVVPRSGVEPAPFPCDSAASQRLSLPPASILSLVAVAS